MQNIIKHQDPFWLNKVVVLLGFHIFSILIINYLYVYNVYNEMKKWILSLIFWLWLNKIFIF